MKQWTNEELHRPVNGITLDGLGGKSLEMLLKRLEQFGNQPSHRQIEALAFITFSYALYCQGKLTGRSAYPLSTGLGKTSSILCFIAAVHELGYDHIKIAVASSQVEQLCQLKKELVEDFNVPAEKVGILHSYPLAQEGDKPGKKTASLPSISEDQAGKCQFLLITHNRVMSRGGTDQYMKMADGSKRDLLVWDEALIATQAEAVGLNDIHKALRYLELDIRNEIDQKAYDYVAEAFEAFTKEEKSQLDGCAPRSLRLPLLTEANLKLYTDYAFAHDKNQMIRKEFQKVLHLAPYALSIARGANQGSGAVRYSVSVPDELNNVVILDASLPIRLLERMDSSISVEDKWSPHDIVNYSGVTVHQIKVASGRGAMNKAFNLKPEKRLLVHEIVDIIKDIPLDEAVLIFTHKTKKGKKDPDFRDILEKALILAGVDTRALIDGKDRINWLTHGNESSFNKFSHCSNVVYCGLLWRSELDMIGSAGGQRRDQLRPFTKEEVNRLLKSEIAFRFHQGLCRGTCRTVRGEKTLPMKAWLTYPVEDLKSLMAQVMPGMTWQWYPTKHLNTMTKVTAMAQKIQRYLDAVSEDKVSTIRIRKECNLNSVSTRTIQRALKLIHNQEGSGWQMKGRSMVTEAARYGF